MTEYLTEQEQIEILKGWIKQYSLVVLAGVLIAFTLITGWRYWQQRQANIISQAAGVYDDMLMSRTQNNASATATQAKKLLSQYPSTVYAQMAALMLARDAVTQKDYSQAGTQLDWIIRKSSTPAFRQIARLRLARIQIAAQKPDESLKTLQTVDDKHFNGLINEVRGDAYLAKKDKGSARAAYKQALQELPNAEVTRPLLQMKYDATLA